jgi:hypothetical protein
MIYVKAITYSKKGQAGLNISAIAQVTIPHMKRSAPAPPRYGAHQQRFEPNTAHTGNIAG